ncbi:DUF6056 family protein [Selenomonas sp. F0473]|uniref:DUF3329 domain-containing protein n=1 Tax=Selenomonas sp. F0473 TaxID=999423 RepID=UPI00029E1BDC|nr:DUF6056 family protein [Selenomonas sp. F0473]EKU70995.1 hypothetical protein HMPREF9161_01089 [Selenomonas sp. F0473]
MRRNVLETVLIACGIFGFMLALNHLMPIHRDDYDYSMIWKTGIHIASLGDVFDSAYRHYFLHGGRMLTVCALILFLWLGKGLFDIANALMFLALAVLLTMHARRDPFFWRAPGLLAAAGILLWLALPHFGEVAVWKSGSTVYLWSAVPAFLFLLPYNLGLRACADGRRPRVPGGPLSMFLLGICAGWSVENLAVTVVLAAAGVSFYIKKAYKTLPLWMPAGTLGALVGLIGLVAAPGNFARYGEQGTGKGILLHIGNQLAGQGEMALYLLPVLLILLTAWRLYRRACAGLPAGETVRPGIGTFVLIAALLLLVFSHMTSGFVAQTIRDAIVFHVMPPLGIDRPKTIRLFTNVMNGFEEAAIYWCTLLVFYARIKQTLGLSAASIRAAAARVPAAEALCAFPAARYALFLAVLAVCDNLVMLAAPTFPGRATFGAAAMFVTAALAVLHDPPVRTALRAPAARAICGAAALLLFASTAVPALLIMNETADADAVRVALIKEAAARGDAVVNLPPIEHTNRALRHVYYEDWYNGVTRDGAEEYYGVQEILVGGK